MKKSLPLKIYSALIYFFLYAPILVMIFLSFNKGRTNLFKGFSLKWYQELFRDEATIQALQNTLILAVLSAIIATIVGTAAAVGIYNYKKKWLRSSVMFVTNIPMVNPDIVTGVSLMLLFVFAGALFGLNDILGFGTLLIAHVTFNIPYVILSVLPVLNQTDPHLAEAARDLGCTPFKAFFKVVLPSITSGIVTGLMMSFTLSLDDFVISYFTNGTFNTLPIAIYSMTRKSVTPDTYALSTLIFVAVLILLILINVSQAKSDKKMKGAKNWKN